MAAAVGTLRRWRWRAAIVAVVIIALVVAIATRGNAADGGTYRTATVDTGDVTQSLTATGSIDSASRSDLAFQVGGDVDDVGVAVGDTVAAGQVLATLDSSDLDDAVTQAQDAVTQAENTLSDDLDAQSSGTAVSNSSSSGSSNSSTMGAASNTTSTRVASLTAFIATDAPAPAAGDLSSAQQAVHDAQQALLDQYDVAQAALATAKADAANATAVCGDFTSTSAEASSTADDIAAALSACQDATSAAIASQQDSADAQSALMDAANSLNAAVSTLLDAVQASGGSGSTGGSGGSGTTGGGSGTSTNSSTTQGTSGSQGGAASGGTSQTGAVPNAADILSDRADVTEAQAALDVANAQVDYASLASPVAGTVVGVGFAAGDSVAAGDTSAAITVIADNTYLVSLSVSLTQARLLAVGQGAELTLLSDNQVVDGTVSSVSTVNSGNNFAQAYAVTISVPDPGFDIRIGTATRMQITVASATDVLVVPTSAVSDATGAATVQVVGDDGTAQTVSVTTGAVGPEYTEIASGLTKGQQVVLADLSLKLSTGSDDSSSTGGLLSGLSTDNSTTQQQFPDPGNFQPPDGFQPPSG